MKKLSALLSILLLTTQGMASTARIIQGDVAEGFHNVLQNGSFDFPTVTHGWTVANGSTSIPSNWYDGKQAILISASSQQSTITQDIIPSVSTSNTNWVSACIVQTALTNVQVCGRSSGSNTACNPVPSTNTPVIVPVNYPAPSTGNSVGVQVGMTSSGSGTFLVDGCISGRADQFNLSQVSQAQIIGGVVITGCASSWSTTGTSFADFATQTGCTYAAFGACSAPSTNIPGVKCSFGPGELKLEYEGSIRQTTSGFLSYYQFWDGTNTARETSVVGASGGLVEAPGINQSISYTTPQTNVTLSIRGKTDSGGTAAIFGTTAQPAVIKVYYFPSQSQTALSSNLPASPTVQKFLSGSGTYTTPSGVKWIEVKMVGAGGGGSGSGSTSAAGSAGSATTFGTSLLTANSGGGGQGGGAGGGSGGSASIGAGAIGLALSGASGIGAQVNVANADLFGGSGGSSPFGGAGASAQGAAGGGAVANTGSGGAGAGTGSTASTITGSGGGAGGYIDALISNPSSTYSYSVSAGGSAGGAGTNGFAGGAGGSGMIEVTEYYGTMNSPLLIGGLTSGGPGTYRVESATVSPSGTGTCTLGGDYTGWLGTTTGTAAGNCTVPFASGVFSATPQCTLTINHSSTVDLIVPKIAAISSSSIQILTPFMTSGSNTVSLTGAATVHMICKGPH